MALIYIDKAVLSNSGNLHPAIEIDESHPCYRMVRAAIDGKSVFHWTKAQAHKMYEWYCEGWKNTELQTEFGESVSDYDFKDIIKASHYLVPTSKSVGNKKLKPSDETIQGMWDAHLMEKKILESIGEDKEDE